MRKYTLVDKTTGEEIEADADTVEHITGVEIGYIDWVLEQVGKFENGDWEVRIVRRQRPSDRFYSTPTIVISSSKRWE